MTDERPNIVLVTMDTARAQNFSCYGYERKTTPFLDKLAEENVKYEHAVSQATWTLPSHASIFSGEYNTEHGICATEDYSSINSFTDKLEEKGYDTIGITNLGFLSEEYKTDEIFSKYEFVTNFKGKSIFEALEIDREKFRNRSGVYKNLELAGKILKDKPSLITNFAARVIEHAGNRLFLRDSGARKTNKSAKRHLEDEPFFLFLNYEEPHASYEPRFPYSHMFLENKLQWNQLHEYTSMNKKPFLNKENEPDIEIMDTLESLYDGEIRYLDSKLKNLYKHVLEKYPNTIFIFTSDHGEYFYEHKKIKHEEGIHSQVTHVPLIEVFPEQIDKEKKGVYELKDLKGHVLDLAAGETSTLDSKECAFSEEIGKPVEQLRKKGVVEEEAEKMSRYRISATTEDYKLIWYSDGEKKLYSMPEEERTENEEKQEELSNKIEENIRNPEEEPIDREEISPQDELIKENLKQLGYL